MPIKILLLSALMLCPLAMGTTMAAEPAVQGPDVKELRKELKAAAKAGDKAKVKELGEKIRLVREEWTAAHPEEAKKLQEERMQMAQKHKKKAAERRLKREKHMMKMKEHKEGARK
jgi:hypothetical protein